MSVFGIGHVILFSWVIGHIEQAARFMVNFLLCTVFLYLVKAVVKASLVQRQRCKRLFPPIQFDCPLNRYAVRR